MIGDYNAAKGGGGADKVHIIGNNNRAEGQNSADELNIWWGTNQRRLLDARREEHSTSGRTKRPQTRLDRRFQHAPGRLPGRLGFVRGRHLLA